MDNILIHVNKKKYKSAQEIINYIKSIKMPLLIDKSQITLLALLDFFQKEYVLKHYILDLSELNIDRNLLEQKIKINSKINNFPHLIGVKVLRDKFGNIISRIKPKEFLDGVFYQWILLSSYEGFTLDFEKLEVFSWLEKTLWNPSYILPKAAINTNKTKFSADLIFIRRILFSSKYSFHIVGLRKEINGNFAFVSQFAIKKSQHHRIKKMFNLKKRIFNFYE